MLEVIVSISESPMRLEIPILEVCFGRGGTVALLCPILGRIPRHIFLGV